MHKGTEEIWITNIPSMYLCRFRFKSDTTIHKTLKKGADGVAEAISSLISLAQSNEAEAAKGVQELAAARAEMNNLIENFDSLGSTSEATAEDIVKSARQVRKPCVCY